MGTWPFASKFLADSHLALSLCEEQKRMDDDFATFRKIFSREFVHVWDVEGNDSLD